MHPIATYAQWMEVAADRVAAYLKVLSPKEAGTLVDWALAETGASYETLCVARGNVYPSQITLLISQAKTICETKSRQRVAAAIGYALATGRLKWLES